MFNTLKQYTDEQYQLALNVLSDVALGRTTIDSQSADMLISYLYHKTLGRETVDKKFAELQDKLSRRNMQIRELKKENHKLQMEINQLYRDIEKEKRH